MEELKNSNKKVGLKECKKAILNNLAQKAYIAQDIEERLLKEFKEICLEKSIEIIEVDSMKNLGKACGIDVGASIVVVLK